ncbi:nucleoside deaminase [Microbispora hainanensis]|jgi:tRNA(Arg) A34 adenosine deaminase TadA|uniref:Nucleoside deaminase n=1 Tax=Microbispora hainanensis TaxID=568844 RepID=A0ABZ1SKL8_9ACTN|nr:MULTISPECIES: nucleoside deaminase [Microbispora]NJP29353.1 nucleoside deaminase [Microbispora sp. CL1-1]TQS05434.1 nucleoside deaminase [Microbispora sp. SCL1-1]
MSHTEIPESELIEYVRAAVRISREHVAKGGIPFSGVVVNDGRVLGMGFNRVREDNDPTAHAEVVALREAAAKYGLHATAGATLIASGEPCALCYMVALYFNVGHIVHAADRETAARYGFDYSGSYSIFAKDPAAWPIKVTSLQIPEGTKPFEEFLAMDRR